MSVSYLDITQWFIQDFPDGGKVCQLQRWGANLLLAQICPKKLLENEKNWSERGRVPVTCKSESFKILKQPCSIGASTNEIIESLN